MLEIPEANVVADQINRFLINKTVRSVLAAASPHKFAWYHGDPAEYSARLAGNSIISAQATGGMIEIKLTHATLLLSDGVNSRYLEPAQVVPEKHQLLITFSDSSNLSCSVQMYGGLSCWLDTDTYDNVYYLLAKNKPSPVTDAFDECYFFQILSAEHVQKLSLKQALATEQRIPGLGNGVLQDILWNAKLSPRRKVQTISTEEESILFSSLKKTLSDMIQSGGRNTEKDLFGKPGDYKVIMSNETKEQPCPRCGGTVVKEAYLGGSVYYCKDCQK